MLRRNGSIDVLNNKRWNGSAWQDCEFIRRWNGSAWVDVWVGTHFGKAPFDIGTYTSTISNGTWNGYIPSDSSSYVETVSLILYPYTNYSVPLTLEIDCDCTVIYNGPRKQDRQEEQNKLDLRHGKEKNIHPTRKIENSTGSLTGRKNTEPDCSGISSAPKCYQPLESRIYSQCGQSIQQRSR